MQSFNRGEHVIAALLDAEKAFNNVGTMDSDTKFISLICPQSFADGSLQFSCRESHTSQS